MNIDEGEEIAGMWVTPHIPQIGIYKLLAKKKKDGTVRFFIQSPLSTSSPVRQNAPCSVSPPGADEADPLSNPT